MCTATCAETMSETFLLFRLQIFASTKAACFLQVTNQASAVQVAVRSFASEYDIPASLPNRAHQHTAAQL